MKAIDKVRRYLWSEKGASLCSAVRRSSIGLLREQGGFTLAETMVALMLMAIVFFALHSVLGTSVRVLSVAKDHNEVASNARPAMERMEREIRAAYPANAGDCTPNNAQDILISPTTSQITFCTNGSSGPQQVSYYNKTNTSNGTITLIRKQATVEQIMAVLGPTTPTPTGSVSFDYYDANNAPVNLALDPVSSISMVKITLTVKVGSNGLNQNGGTQTLTSYVSLRNK